MNLIDLTFDPENRLTASLECPITSYGYDGDGLRAWKSSPNFFTGPTKTYFLYDGDDPLLEMNSSGNVIAANGYGADGPRSRYNPGNQTTTYYTFDPQGNVVQRTESTALSPGARLRRRASLQDNPWSD